MLSGAMLHSGHINVAIAISTINTADNTENISCTTLYARYSN